MVLLLIAFDELAAHDFEAKRLAKLLKSSASRAQIAEWLLQGIEVLDSCATRVGDKRSWPITRPISIKDFRRDEKFESIVAV